MTATTIRKFNSLLAPHVIGARPYQIAPATSGGILRSGRFHVPFVGLPIAATNRSLGNESATTAVDSVLKYMYHEGGSIIKETTIASSCEVDEITPNNFQASRSAASQEAISNETLRERYEEQQRRLACPSFGEEPFLG
jgi:hypothetical protein